VLWWTDHTWTTRVTATNPSPSRALTQGAGDETTIGEKLAGLEARVQDRVESALVRQTRELAGKDDYPPPNHGSGSSGDGHSDGSACGRGPGSRGAGRCGEASGGDMLQHQSFQEGANRKRTMQRAVVA
jgi:hypothetical protein